MSSKVKKKSVSPKPSSHLKRKHQASTLAPPPKRKKSVSEHNASEDATRKYCLGRLQEVFNEIFLKYPLADMQGSDAEDGCVSKAPKDLTEEERTRLKDLGRKFAEELEQCVFDIYSEPDKQSLPSAGGKYKCVVFVLSVTRVH
jgi:hypothetical protein